MAPEVIEMSTPTAACDIWYSPDIDCPAIYIHILFLLFLHDVLMCSSPHVAKLDLVYIYCFVSCCFSRPF